MADKPGDRKLVEGKYLMYKNRPLVREGNTICYGDMNEEYILILEIMSYKNVDRHKVPDAILIQIIDSKDPMKIIKQGSKEGLHDAFLMGVVWLEMALKQAD
ncbi:MAG TPA: hypothetical protein GX011_08015 [Clostridiales bacterium]|jgi:hypothetical protein|nr:hypothetical protein [Clostridiales bacterium]